VRLRDPAPPLGAAAAWFAIVGAAVGALAGALAYLAAPQLGTTVAAILAVTMLVVLTGALHADGLADCADGLGVRGDRARRLAVMRDSPIGTFGALALVLWALLLVSALAGLERGDALRALVVAAAPSRRRRAPTGSARGSRREVRRSPLPRPLRRPAPSRWPESGTASSCCSSQRRRRSWSAAGLAPRSAGAPGTRLGPQSRSPRRRSRSRYWALPEARGQQSADFSSRRRRRHRRRALLRQP